MYLSPKGFFLPEVTARCFWSPLRAGGCVLPSAWQSLCLVRAFVSGASGLGSYVHVLGVSNRPNRVRLGLDVLTHRWLGWWWQLCVSLPEAVLLEALAREAAWCGLSCHL